MKMLITLMIEGLGAQRGLLSPACPHVAEQGV